MEAVALKPLSVPERPGSTWHKPWERAGMGPGTVWKSCPLVFSCCASTGIQTPWLPLEHVTAGKTSLPPSLPPHFSFYAPQLTGLCNPCGLKPKVSEGLMLDRGNLQQGAPWWPAMVHARTPLCSTASRVTTLLRDRM